MGAHKPAESVPEDLILLLLGLVLLLETLRRPRQYQSGHFAESGARGGGRVLGERTRAVVASVRGEWELGELEGALGGDRHGVRVPRTAV